MSNRIRVHVRDDADTFQRNLLDVYVTTLGDGGEPLVYQTITEKAGELETRFTRTVPQSEGKGPSFSIPLWALKEVMAALTQHIENTPPPGDAAALRRDLDHEKGRVDKMLDALLEMALPPTRPES